MVCAVILVYFPISQSTMFGEFKLIRWFFWSKSLLFRQSRKWGLKTIAKLVVYDSIHEIYKPTITFRRATLYAKQMNICIYIYIYIHYMQHVSITTFHDIINVSWQWWICFGCHVQAVYQRIVAAKTLSVTGVLPPFSKTNPISSHIQSFLK